MKPSDKVRVGVFFDGTGNNQANADAPPGRPQTSGSYANARSNIALLHALYPSGALAGQHYFKFYMEGIGTTEGKPDSLFAQATGRGDSGVEARVAQALAAMGERLQVYLAGQPGQPPARIEFDLFGFSRGAAAARHLANRLALGEKGLPAPLSGERMVNFIGLFDTVAAIVAPLRGDFDPANEQNGNLRLGVGKHLANHVVQLVAGDEQRRNFPLVRSDNDIVVPGVHSDIGGGYRATMREQVLLSKPCTARVSFTTPAERTVAYAETLAQLASTFAHLDNPRPSVLTWEQPVGGRRAAPEKHVYAAVYREREVQGHLSRVYLSVMRELALRAGVPFAALGQDPAHHLPDELLAVSRKLHDFALGASPRLQLSVQEDRLLRGRYVHTSAHWNALKGLDGSALDYVYVDRPGEKGRVMHANPPR